MNFEQLISIATVVSTLCVKLIGFPDQMRKVRKTKDISSISIPNFALIFITYILWTIHGIQVNDKTIIIGQGIGVLASGTLLGFLLYYWRRTKNDT